MTVPPSPDRLVRDLAGSASPVLTWYSRDGERLELSGPTFARWVAKTSHLLADLDVAPGDQVAVDLPASWRAPVIWFATWLCGATVVLGPASEEVAVAVVADGSDLGDLSQGSGTEGAVETVVVAAPALARAAAQLPAGAVDYAATVASFPDALPPAAPSPAVAVLTHGVAIAWDTLARPGTLGRVAWGPGAAPADIVGTWSAGGRVILHDGHEAGALGRVLAGEHALDGHRRPRPAG